MDVERVEGATSPGFAGRDLTGGSEREGVGAALDEGREVKRGSSGEPTKAPASPSARTGAGVAARGRAAACGADGRVAWACGAAVGTDGGYDGPRRVRGLCRRDAAGDRIDLMTGDRTGDLYGRSPPHKRRADGRRNGPTGRAGGRREPRPATARRDGRHNGTESRSSGTGSGPTCAARRSRILRDRRGRTSSKRRPPPYSGLQTAADAGPVAIVGTSIEEPSLC